jgi:hypothetical protein
MGWQERGYSEPGIRTAYRDFIDTPCQSRESYSDSITLQVLVILGICDAPNVGPQ